MCLPYRLRREPWWAVGSEGLHNAGGAALITARRVSARMFTLQFLKGRPFENVRSGPLSGQYRILIACPSKIGSFSP
jgi:hypothetical protein